MDFCRFIQRIDFFGQEPEFYFDGKRKQVTIIGRIFTYIFISLYILIFCYKLYRMTQRIDITFYDSYSNTDEIPSVKIIQDNFTLVFGLHDSYGSPFIDDTIYYTVAYYFNEGNYEEIDFERCNENHLSEAFIEYLGRENLNEYFCLSDINYELRPFMNSLRLEVYPCIDLYEGEGYCESREFIDEYLNNLLFMIYLEDINLTPLNYVNPVKKKISSFNTEIFRNLGQFLYNEMQIVKIETSTNIIGFDFFTNPKMEDFIKYDKQIIMTYPGYNVLDENNTYPATIFEVQLNDRILLEKREYVQLTEVLGEIGGLMEIIDSLFSVICSVFVEIIYEKRIINKLFSFDINKRLILFKEPKNSSFKTIEDNGLDEINIFKQDKNSVKNKKKKSIKNKMILTSNLKNTNNSTNEACLATKNKASENKSSRKEIKLENIDFKKDYEENKNSLDNLNNTIKKEDKNEQSIVWIINKINLKYLLISKCCCCCKKYKKNVYSLISNESMKLIKEKLDIINIFRNLYIIENSNNVINKNFDSIKMSEECTKELLDIKKS